MKSISSFEDVVPNEAEKAQGKTTNKKLTFEELHPFIDESDSDYSVEDLLSALN